MKTETKTASFGSARGQTFNPAVSFTYEFVSYENADELVAAKDELSLAEQVKIRNSQRDIRARQAAQNAKLDEMGIEKQDATNNEQIRLRDMFKTLMTSKKYTEEQAREVASNVLGIAWDE